MYVVFVTQNIIWKKPKRSNRNTKLKEFVMIIIEALLLTILLFTCVYATFTDIKHGIIENRILARAVILGLILNLLYYIVYAQNLMVSFLVNIAITSLISILFYAYHIWAAGDTKLIFVVIFRCSRNMDYYIGFFYSIYLCYL